MTDDVIKGVLGCSFFLVIALIGAHPGLGFVALVLWFFAIACFDGIINR